MKEFLNPNSRKLTAETEDFWSRHTEALRDRVEAQAARIAAPHLDSLWNQPQNASPAKRKSVLWRVVVPVAAAMLLLVLSQFKEPTKDTSQALFVEQVFLSTSGIAPLDLIHAEHPDPGTFSTLLKTIDKGFSHWDEASEE